jgi:hypothetical protein
MPRLAFTTPIALAFTLSPLAAQDSTAVAGANQRAGFWMGAAAGYGTSKVSCTDCLSVPKRDGLTLLYRMGGTLNPAVRLGAELSAWTKTEAGSTDWLFALSFAVYDYAMPTRPVFLKVGVGYSKFYETNSTYPAGSGGSGFGAIAGLGYDLRITRNVFLTPGLNFVYGHVGDVTVGTEGIVSGWSQYVVDFVVGVTAQFPPSHPDHR